MVTVTIVLTFPFGKIKNVRFDMELPRVPQKGEIIEAADAIFGPKYTAFLEEVKKECRLVGGCNPQFVTSIGYYNNRYIVTVSCNPDSVILIWDSILDHKRCFKELKFPPQKGDVFTNDRRYYSYITKVICLGYNFYRVEFTEASPQEEDKNPNDAVVDTLLSTNAILHDISFRVDSMADNTRDIARRVEDIYYQNR